jgi:hypothetical protein
VLLVTHEAGVACVLQTVVEQEAKVAQKCFETAFLPTVLEEVGGHLRKQETHGEARVCTLGRGFDSSFLEVTVANGETGTRACAAVALGNVHKHEERLRTSEAAGSAGERRQLNQGKGNIEVWALLLELNAGVVEDHSSGSEVFIQRSLAEELDVEVEVFSVVKVVVVIKAVVVVKLSPKVAIVVGHHAVVNVKVVAVVCAEFIFGYGEAAVGGPAVPVRLATGCGEVTIEIVRVDQQRRAGAAWTLGGCSRSN